MINLLIFGNEKYYDAIKRISISMKSINDIKLIIITDKDLENTYKDFWNIHNEFISSNSIGYGYWIWKPYIILKTIDDLNADDILIYMDSGCELNHHNIDKLYEYINMVKQSEYGIISFEMKGFLEKQWTKKNVFMHFNCLDNKQITDTNQYLGGVIIMKKCIHVLKLLKLWYDTLSNYVLLDGIKHLTLHGQVPFNDLVSICTAI